MNVREVLRSLFGFGRVKGSDVSAERNTVRVTIEGVPGLDLEDQELWGSAALLMRPADPDADGRGAEVLFLRLGDELVAIASRDTRNQVSLSKGEVVLRALAGAAKIGLKTNGELHLNGEDEPIALGDSTDTRISAIESKLNSLIAIFNAHVHAGVTTGGGSSAVSPTPETTLTPGSSVGSSSVKAAS